MMEWQTMETAPKHFTIRLLLAVTDYQDRPAICVGWWSEDYAEWETYDIGGRTDIQPTHWQPLPPPPNDGTKP